MSNGSNAPGMSAPSVTLGRVESVDIPNVDGPLYSGHWASSELMRLDSAANISPGTFNVERGWTVRRRFQAVVSSSGQRTPYDASGEYTRAVVQQNAHGPPFEFETVNTYALRSLRDQQWEAFCRDDTFYSSPTERYLPPDPCNSRASFPGSDLHVPQRAREDFPYAPFILQSVREHDPLLHPLWRSCRPDEVAVEHYEIPNGLRREWLDLEALILRAWANLRNLPNDVSPTTSLTFREPLLDIESALGRFRSHSLAWARATTARKSLLVACGYLSLLIAKWERYTRDVEGWQMKLAHGGLSNMDIDRIKRSDVSRWEFDAIKGPVRRVGVIFDACALPNEHAFLLSIFIHARVPIWIRWGPVTKIPSAGLPGTVMVAASSDSQRLGVCLSLERVDIRLVWFVPPASSLAAAYCIARPESKLSPLSDGFDRRAHMFDPLVFLRHRQQYAAVEWLRLGEHTKCRLWLSRVRPHCTSCPAPLAALDIKEAALIGRSPEQAAYASVYVWRRVQYAGASRYHRQRVCSPSELLALWKSPSFQGKRIYQPLFNEYDLVEELEEPMLHELLDPAAISLINASVSSSHPSTSRGGPSEVPRAAMPSGRFHVDEKEDEDERHDGEPDAQAILAPLPFSLGAHVANNQDQLVSRTPVDAAITVSPKALIPYRLLCEAFCHANGISLSAPYESPQVSWITVMRFWGLCSTAATPQAFLHERQDEWAGSLEDALAAMRAIHGITSALIELSMTKKRVPRDFLDPREPAYRVQFHQVFESLLHAPAQPVSRVRWMVYPREEDQSAPKSPWYIMVFDVLSVQFCLASTLSMKDLALHLARLGVRFSTVQLLSNKTESQLQAAEQAVEREASSLSRDVLWRQKGWKSTNPEFLAWLETVRHWCLTSGRVRAALLRGGVVWRIVSIFVTDVDALVSRGPTERSIGQPRHLKTPTSFKNGFWVDDSLSQDELDLICGVHHLLGDKQEVAMMAYFPRDNVWNGAALNVGLWTELSEQWFQRMFNGYMNNKEQPRTLAAMRDWLRGDKKEVAYRGNRKYQDVRDMMETAWHEELVGNGWA